MKDRHVSSLRRGVVELAVLSLLDSSPRYGQQIVEDLSEVPGLDISSGTLYPLVSRMLKDGLISSRWQESPVGPPRKYYSLTSAGRETLASMSRTWLEIRRGLDSLLKEGA